MMKYNNPANSNTSPTRCKSFSSLLSWRLFAAQDISGVLTPKTYWAVNKRQDNKLEKLLHLVGDLYELYDDART
jgi:hypothetical protein